MKTSVAAEAGSGKPRMSPKRRFLAALFGASPDRVPVGNVVSVATVDLMREAGAWFPEAHRDAELMARLAGTGHDVLGYDTVMPVFSVTQEAEALGCVVDWGGPQMMPGATSHPFSGTGDFQLPRDWLEAPSIQVVLAALRRLRGAYGAHAVVVGKVMGPWSLSYHLMGIEEFLITTVEDVDRARRSLDALAPVSVAFARAQMHAGADIICLADHATGGMVSPLMYRDLLLPLHQQIVERMACPTVLHCCGDTSDRLAYFAQTGVDCYHFESAVDVSDAVGAAMGNMALIGNVNNPQTLLGGSRDDVFAECRRAMAGGVNILAPECAVPLTTPTDNLRTLVDAAEALARESGR